VLRTLRAVEHDAEHAARLVPLLSDADARVRAAAAEARASDLDQISSWVHPAAGPGDERRVTT
jgi:hypothetical protein